MLIKTASRATFPCNGNIIHLNLLIQIHRKQTREPWIGKSLCIIGFDTNIEDHNETTEVFSRGTVECLSLALLLLIRSHSHWLPARLRLISCTIAKCTLSCTERSCFTTSVVMPIHFTQLHPLKLSVKDLWWLITTLMSHIEFYFHVSSHFVTLWHTSDDGYLTRE